MSGQVAPSRTALERLLAPISRADFFAQYWEKRPLYVERGDADAYADVLTEGDLDALLARNDLRYPTVRLVRDAQSIPVSAYASVLRFGSYAAEGLIDSDRVYREFASGTTILCQLLQQSIPRTRDFIRSLSQELGFRVDAHAFITPRSSRGLGTHYDTGSAFILQIAGSKVWRLFKPTFELPTDDQTFDESKPVDYEPAGEFHLRAGDLLYLPGGVPHAPVTTDRHSTHVTAVLFPPTWLDLFTRSLEDCVAEVTLRAAPRPGRPTAPEVETQVFDLFAKHAQRRIREETGIGSNE